VYILLTYDVSTVTKAGQKRLRNVAKTCLDYGQRVQNSVFECKMDHAQFVQFRGKLLSIIDTETDSVRIYHLGKNWEQKVEHHGKNDDYNIEGPLIL
jgi:CRISPR-associated protein Cas2